MRVSALAICLAVVASSRAESQPSTPFEKLVDEAQAVVVTEALDTHTGWRQLRERQVIVTEVRLRVDRLLKGGADGVLTLTFLGGTVGDVTQRVAGVPRFMVGDKDVLFLASTRSLVAPIVAMPEGRFRIVSGHGGTGQYIANFALQPIAATSNYRNPTKIGPGQRALSLDDFISDIATLISGRGRP